MAGPENQAGVPGYSYNQALGGSFGGEPEPSAENTRWEAEQMTALASPAYDPRYKDYRGTVATTGRETQQERLAQALKNQAEYELTGKTRGGGGGGGGGGGVGGGDGADGAGDADRRRPSGPSRGEEEAFFRRQAQRRQRLAGGLTQAAEPLGSPVGDWIPSPLTAINASLGRGATAPLLGGLRAAMRAY